MSTVTVPKTSVLYTPLAPTPHSWPADLLAFAHKHDVERVLEPMREVTHRLFPMARDIRVFLEQDLADPTWWDIVFEVWVATDEYQQCRALRFSWIDEWYRIDPRPKMIPFVLAVRPEAE